MLDGEGPVLLRARGHEHAPVALVEPAQVRERLVDLEVVAIVPHALGAVRDAAPGRERDRMERKLLLCDDAVEPALEGLGKRIEMCVCGAVEDLEQGDLRGGHGQRVPVESARLY